MKIRTSRLLSRSATLSCLTAIPVISALATQANAELTMNGVLDLELARNSDTLINTKRVGGSFSGLVWRDFGMQADLGLGKHESYTSSTSELTLHLYKQTDDLAMGVYLSAEDRRPGNSYYYGAEARYFGEIASVEGFAAYRDDIAESTDGFRWGVEASFTPAPQSPFGYHVGYVRDTGEPLVRDYAYIGASYEISDGVDIGIEAGRTDSGAMIAAISATLTFGSGRVFSPRDSFSLYPGY